MYKWYAFAGISCAGAVKYASKQQSESNSFVRIRRKIHKNNKEFRFLHKSDICNVQLTDIDVYEYKYNMSQL